MARYEPRHLKKRKRKTEKTREKNGKKKIIIYIGVAYIFWVVFSTLYSVFIYPTTLPQVTVMSPEKMKMKATGVTFNYSLPKECVFYEEGLNEYYCYVVLKQDGGFGPKYFAVKNTLETAKHYFHEEETNVPYAGSTYSNLPYVRTSTEPLYNYCEVSVVAEKNP